MFVAGSARTRAHSVRWWVVLVAATAAVIALISAVNAPARAATLYKVSLEPPVAVEGSIGAPDTNPHTPSDCPSGSAVTELDTVHLVSWLTGVQPVCTALGGGATVSLGASTPADLLTGDRGNTLSGENSVCPQGTVAVGLGGRGGTLLDAVQLVCEKLLDNGTLDTTRKFGALAGGTGGNAVDPFFCPDNAVITELTAQLGQDITDLQIACSQIDVTVVAPPLPDNTSWPHARLISANSSVSDQSIDTPGEELWYAVPIQPGSQVHVTLTGLTNNLDLAVFTDISQAFTTLTSTQDLTHLSAEFAGDAFAPSVFSPSVFSPSVFSPSVFSPSVFSPSVFSPSVFSPSVFSPSVFSPSVFSPSVFSPSVFSPAVSLPSVFSPSVFSGGTPDQTTLANAFSSAQIRSLIGVSANDGTADESVTAETWNNTGNYYIRVNGRNGATSPFTLSVTTTGGPCSTPLDDHATDPTITGTPGPTTVILTDPGRMSGSPSDITALNSAVASFATQVHGAVVNLGSSAKVQALDHQADTLASCPFAKNLAAQAIRDIVNSYRGPNLKYVVIVGDDAVVPFFRYADTAGLGPENGYFPPMSDSSAAQAALRSNDYLSQDAYGASIDIAVKGTVLPIPDLAVGRLVETPSEITATLQRYASTPVIHPNSTLATGYDFLADSAKSVAADFAAGDPSGRNDTLITNQGVPTSQTTVGGVPDPNHSWTATDLANALLGHRHDVVYLAGHFSANSALAADYTTSLITTQLAASTTDFSNSLVFSAGCHSGYNIVDQEGVPGVTLGLDWAQAFAQKGATLIAGTGYQYGDTDFVAYSDKLYALLAHDLREGTGAVAIGSALVQAKQDYLATLTSVAGIDQKSLLESTLYGLPMQGVDFAGRVPAPTTGPTTTPSNVDPNTPGSTLGLQSTFLHVTPALTSKTTTLSNTSGGTVTASYLDGPDGIVTSPGAPTLPLDSQDVTAAGTVLRGIGLRSATYSDTDGVIPLTGAATTEQSAAHGPFTSTAFWPNRIATPNYFDAVSGGQTTVNITPAQYRTDSSGVTDTERKYSDVGLELYYSNNISTYGANTPALAAPPSISGVSAQASGDNSSVHVSAHVVGDPSAGIQQVWVTFTGEPGSSLHGTWQSIDLTQDSTDSTLWSGNISIPDNHADKVRFIVQAVNGVGEVGVDDNVGMYYSAAVTPGVPPALTVTHLSIDSSVPAHAPVGSTVTVGATLTDDSHNGVNGVPVYFSIGSIGAVGVTDGSGHATAAMKLDTAGQNTLTALFSGTDTLASATSDPVTITVDRQATALALRRNADGSFAATLTDGSGTALPSQTVMFVSSAGSTTTAATPAQTDVNGIATFAASAVGSGSDTVQAWFGDPNTPVPGGTSDQTSALFLPSRSAALHVATLTLTDSTSGSAGFGSLTTFTLHASGHSGSSSLPTGTVQFRVDGTLVGSGTLSSGTASIATRALLPGPHTITASYSGDESFLPGSASVAHTVTCGTTVTGTVHGSVTARGSSFCVINANVVGPVVSTKGVPVAIVNSTLTTAIFAGGGQTMICGSHVLTALNISNATGLVVVGDPGHSQCSANTIGATLTLTNDVNGVEAINNTVPVVVATNVRGPGPYPGDVTTISGNHG